MSRIYVSSVNFHVQHVAQDGQMRLTSVADPAWGASLMIAEPYHFVEAATSASIAGQNLSSGRG